MDLMNLFECENLRGDGLLFLSISEKAGKNGYYFYNNIFNKLGVHGIYLNCPTSTLDGIRETFSFLKIHGASIAAPFKQVIFSFLDDMTEVARRTRSVNSVKQEDGVLVGHNTDEAGLRRVLTNYLPENSRPEVLIYGSGGVVPSVVSAIRDISPGANISLSGRNRLQRKEICETLDLDCIDRTDLRFVDLWINATPASIENPETIVDLSSNAKIVFDLIPVQGSYPFEKMILERGQLMIRGFDLYREQFIEQFHFFLGYDLERALFDELAKRRVL